MKVYFISAKKRKSKLHNDVIKIVENLGHKIEFDLVDDTEKEQRKQDFDVMIADIEETSTMLGSHIIFALIDRKPALGLYSDKIKAQEGILPPERERYLKYLSVKSFNKDNLEEIIRDFLEEREGQMHARFNFFVASDISNYLDWITFSRQQSRADFIRRLVRDQLKQDKQYKSYIESKNKK